MDPCAGGAHGVGVVWKVGAGSAKGDADEAAAWIERAIELDPESEYLRAQLEKSRGA